MKLWIGNWVNLRVGIQLKKEPHKITINDLVNIHNKVAFYDFTPIPLTEEWLELKFGFEKDTTKHIYRIQLGDYVLEVSRNAFSGTLEKDANWFFTILTGFGSQPVTITRSYVHQLQNFYFVHTDNEL